MKHQYKQADFSLRIDLYANLIFAFLWYLAPVMLLSYNFDVKNYDCIHKHFARVLGVSLLVNAMISSYALGKKCPYTKSKILCIKVIGGLLLLATMAYDNYSCTMGIMGSRHVLFGIWAHNVQLFVKGCLLLHNIRLFIIL